jgi:hypothetical protein
MPKMFSNLQIRPAKPHRRKISLTSRSGVSKRRISRVSASASNVPSMSFMEGLFGDEFPEAFGSGATKSKKSILDLPAELLAVVCDELSRLDIKRLRLSNKYLATNVDLRIDRVYVSPNRSNLDSLRKILEHPRYRHQVFELVWDDAQLDEYLDLDSFRAALLVDENFFQIGIEQLLKELSEQSPGDNMDSGAFEHDDFFNENGKLTEVAKGVLLRHDTELSRDIIAKYATVMSIEENYDIYKELYHEEQAIMKRGLDAAALQNVLGACPNLQRIILTSEVWRPWNLQPLYQTPFHRSLPPGFRKPSVWPWLDYHPQSSPAQTTQRDRIMSTIITNQNNSLPSEFRGYSIIISSLVSMPEPQISEFIIYSGHETAGIGHQLLATPNADFQNTLTLAQKAPLKRLVLSFNSYGADHNAQTSYLHTTQLHDLLNAMPHLEHLDLSPNCHPRREPRSVTQGHFQLSHIPIALRFRLRTFTIRNAQVIYEDLLQLIKHLTSAQHITLDNLSIFSPSSVPATYLNLFRELWTHYEYNAGPAMRPAFTVSELVQRSFRSRLVFEELSEYLHCEDQWGEMPFVEGEGESIKSGVGWVVDDRDERFMVRACDVGEVWEEGMGMEE